MTTVVWRDGVLAADSRCMASGSIQPGNMTKIWRVKNRLVSGTGDANRIQMFLRWVKKGARGTAPEMGETNGILIEPDGRVREFEGVGEVYLEAPFYAWGTGMQAALAALYMDATAEKAVEIAMLVDPRSGGAIQSIRL
jgi:20S proteasome alpha/beta subunit